MNSNSPEVIGESHRYWTHGVESFPSPVAQFRMAQLIDMDDRLYETARVVYRFMVGWYHDGYGDALLSQRHVAKVMKQRAPECAVVPSRNAVQRAILALMETGWVVRSFQGRGRGKGASRYVPVMNVLELAAQGKFPKPAHATGPVQPAHSIGPLVAHATGPVDAEPAHATGPKTLPPDTATEPMTGMVDVDFAPPVAGLAAAPVAKEGFEELFDVYNVRKDKADARRAYDTLAPDADLHARMVSSAKAWREAAGTIERMRLRRWIEEERYDEDPKGERKQVPARPTPLASNDNKRPSGKIQAVVTIESAEVATEAGITEVTLYFDDATNHSIYVEHQNARMQEEGQTELARLKRALDLTSLDDSSELEGLTLTVTRHGSAVAFSPAPSVAA